MITTNVDYITLFLKLLSVLLTVILGLTVLLIVEEYFLFIIDNLTVIVIGVVALGIALLLMIRRGKEGI